MPTGYTAGVQEGKITELKDFALLCARAFGIALSMRDEPLSTPMPDQFKADTDYEDRRIFELKSELNDLKKMSSVEIVEAEQKEYDERMKSYRERCARMEQKGARYEAMIEKVKAWTPPPLLHELKKFMLDQLVQSMDFDVYKVDLPVRDESPEAWFNKKVKEITKSIGYSTERREQIIANTEQKNKLLRELCESLEGEFA